MAVDSGPKARSLFEQVKIVTKPPPDCTADEIESFRALVIEGGQKAGKKLDNQIRRAGLLAFGYEGERLVSIAAVKRAGRLYISDLFRKANAFAESRAYRWEIGWLYTLPDFRNHGASRELICELLDRFDQHNLFATSRAENEAVRKLFTRLGFQVCGAVFGKRKSWQLYVRKVNDGEYLGAWLAGVTDYLLLTGKRIRKYVRGTSHGARRNT